MSFRRGDRVRLSCDALTSNSGGVGTVTSVCRGVAPLTVSVIWDGRLTYHYYYKFYELVKVGV